MKLTATANTPHELRAAIVDGYLKPLREKIESQRFDTSIRGKARAAGELQMIDTITNALRDLAIEPNTDGPRPVALTDAERKVLMTAAGFLDASKWDETISEREHKALKSANAKLEGFELVGEQ